MPRASKDSDGNRRHLLLIPILALGNLVMFGIISSTQNLLRVSSESHRISVGRVFDKSNSFDASSSALQPTRRTKLHLCPSLTRSKHGYNILKNEFGFQDVNATAGDDWDLLFGGYPYCGTNKDYNMKTGLNKMLVEPNQGFDTLKPQQVYFPCMGCTDTYCNKEKLCRLQRAIDPESCYLLPQDYDVVYDKMKQQPNKTWVLKRDSTKSAAAVHSGQGVRMIHSPNELPTKKERANYLVQPFVDSYLGKGDLRRKTEVRYYVAITSISPLRVYYFNDQWMPLSSTLWVDNPPSALYKRCMEDSHAYKRDCISVAKKVNGYKRVRFTDYQKATNMPASMVTQFHQEAIDMMRQIFHSSQDVMQSNHINQKITTSGASCFSFMRADFGISSEGHAFLYEINELPYGSEPRIAGQVQMQAYRDLFQMIGLADTPLPSDKRAAYEARNAGNWTLLDTSGS